MKVLLIPGKLEYDEYLKIYKSICTKINLEILINHKKQYKKYGWENHTKKVWSIEPDVFLNANYSVIPFHEKYTYVLNSIVNDIRTSYLVERVFGVGGAKTVFNHTLKIEKFVWNSLALLNEIKPDKIVIPTIPHSSNWFFVKTAELIGIEVLVTATSPIPSKSWIVRGLEDQSPIIFNKIGNLSCEDNSSLVEDFINKIKKPYSEAMPEYERKRQERYGGKVFNFKGELLNIIGSSTFSQALLKLKSAFFKVKYYRLYQSLSQNVNLPEKYVVFLLHFQPERTTLPEGGVYVQQWLAIKEVFHAIPKGWKLLVKEHPSMFRNTFSNEVRDRLFYDSIAALPDTYLCPISIPQFDLIDKAKAIITITGTVGVEAIIRKKPVVVFGNAQYRNYRHAHFFTDSKGLSKFFHKISVNGFQVDDSEINEYFFLVDRNSFNQEKSNISIQAITKAIELKT